MFSSLLAFVSGIIFSAGAGTCYVAFFSPREDDEPEIPDQRLRGSEGLYNYHRN
jgi:hypothetical protein